MRVLLIATDLYKTVGGGQAVYRRIIAANPEIKFVYFRVAESPSSSRPPNVESIPLAPRRMLHVTQPFFPKTRLNSLITADAFARSVAGQDFDVVELPDYFAFGPYFRESLNAHSVKFGGLALSMHGNISTSIAFNWNEKDDSTFVERELEYEQFVDVDGRYAISMRYIKEWQARVDLDIHYLDPAAIVGPPAPVQWVRKTNSPELYCIGRTERLKGNDLFVEIVRWLNRDLFSRACHVGDIAFARDGVSSEEILRKIARAREVGIDFLPSQSRSGLASLFARNAVVVLPVRYDTLNLIALEVLFAGCPLVVSSGAGVCDYLDNFFPRLPYVKLDLSNFYGVVEKIEPLLKDYAASRQRLLGALVELPTDVATVDLMQFYWDTSRRGGRAPSVNYAVPPVRYREVVPTVLDRSLALARKVLPGVVRRPLGRLRREPKAVAAGVILRLEGLNDPKLASHARESLRLRSKFHRINAQAESSVSAVAEKIRTIQRLATGLIYRCNVWLELARLETLRSNELVAVSYELRLMRLLGGDRFGRLRYVTATLERHGFNREAQACEALYRAPADAETRVHAYLKNAYERCLKSEQRSFERVDDRRSGTPRVSVIVSLYNAHTKLKLFLTMLSLQTLVRRGEVEVVLMDSGSKGNEYEVMKEFLANHSISVVYARSAQRETIQAAWNRGIHLARAPYLVFLGVDEALYPDALETLAEELDRNPAADWVMSNSLVTEVDEQGVFRKDVMPYDRSGGTKDYTYLETCYLSWVGGMYRKSIHERFGYYDESFRAAGDTEFKNRVLPYVRVKFIPRMLGLFLNYPEARTTASPVAEIEDSRAWYLHRTPGGVRYAFEDRDPGEALALLYTALGYRKSYCTHISSDIEYAQYLAMYLARTPLTQLPALQRDLSSLLEGMRKLEWTDTEFATLTPARTLRESWRIAQSMESTHSKLLEGRARPAYTLFNDNRFEQHSWIWMTDS